MSAIECEILIRNGNVACILAKIARRFPSCAPTHPWDAGDDFLDRIDGVTKMLEDYRSDTLLADTVATYADGMTGQPSGALAFFIQQRNDAIPQFVSFYARLREGLFGRALVEAVEEVDAVLARVEAALFAMRDPMVAPLTGAEGG